MANPQYPGQQRRSLLLSFDPEAPSLMGRSDPPGLWASALVAGPVTSEDFVRLGRPTPRGDMMFLPAAVVEAMLADREANSQLTYEDPRTGLPIEEAGIQQLADVDLARRRLTYGVEMDIIPSRDGSWMLHPDDEPVPSSHPVSGNLSVVADQVKEVRWGTMGLSPEVVEAERGMTLDQIVEKELAAYEAEGEYWAVIDEDLEAPEAEPVRETLVNEHSPELQTARQEALMASFAEETRDMTREQLEEQAALLEGWEGVSAKEFLIASSMYRYMREHEGTQEPRSPEQEMGSAKLGWAKRIPALGFMRDRTKEAVRYCTDADFRKEVHAEALRPLRETGQSVKEGFAAGREAAQGRQEVRASEAASRREARAQERASRRAERQADREERRDDRRAFFDRIKGRVTAEAVGLREGVKQRANEAYARLKEGGEAVRDGMERAIDDVASRASAAKEAAAAGVRRGAARGLDGLAGGIDAVVNAPDRLRATASRLRGTGPEQEAAAEQPSSAFATTMLEDELEAVLNPSGDELDEAIARSEEGSMTQAEADEFIAEANGGASVESDFDLSGVPGASNLAATEAEVDAAVAAEDAASRARLDLVVLVDRDAETGAYHQAAVQVNQASLINAGEEELDEPRVALGLDADEGLLTDVVAKAGGTKRVTSRQGAFSTEAFSVSAEVRLDERGVPVVGSLADLADVREGPEISEGIADQQWDLTQLAKDRRRRPAPSIQPADGAPTVTASSGPSHIRSRDEDLLSAAPGGSGAEFGK